MPNRIGRCLAGPIADTVSARLGTQISVTGSEAWTPKRVISAHTPSARASRRKSTAVPSARPWKSEPISIAAAGMRNAKGAPTKRTAFFKIGKLKSEVNQMRSIRPIHNLLTLLAVGALAAVMGGCSTAPRKSPDVAGDIRGALDQAGLKDVSVSQDRDKGVITLSGHVPADGDKAQGASIDTSAAGAKEGRN